MTGGRLLIGHLGARLVVGQRGGHLVPLEEHGDQPHHLPAHSAELS